MGVGGLAALHFSSAVATGADLAKWKMILAIPPASQKPKIALGLFCYGSCFKTHADKIIL